MGPTSFPKPASPKLKVICNDANGNNASKHLRRGRTYEVTNIVTKAKSARGDQTATQYALKGVDYLWDASRFSAA